MIKRLSAGLLLAVFTVFALLASARADTPAPKDEHKQTTLGKYMTAEEAYQKWSSDSAGVKVLDVRTPEEYTFVGHAPMARNLPVRVWSGTWNAQKKSYDLLENPGFQEEAKKLFKPDETILVMCRSGQRSAAAVNLLAKAGFTNAYTVVDGFEGDAVTAADSPDKGKRTLNGWKNSKAPWTYALDPALVYIPAR